MRTMTSYTVTRQIAIDAGHRVMTHGSKCRHLHGHRYTIEASCLADHLQAGGEQSDMVLDFGFLKDEMMAEIDGPCDHGFLAHVEDADLLAMFCPEQADPAAWIAAIRTTVGRDKFCLTTATRLGTKLYVLDVNPTAEQLCRHWFGRSSPWLPPGAAGWPSYWRSSSGRPPIAGHPTGTVSLPIESTLPALRAALAAGSNAVLEAPPGAGKTTLVPLALLDAPWLGRRKIVMLEPRRLAARAAARRMATLLGESVGETVGYRIRQDSKIGPATRIEVVTEGILTRMIQDDPGLEGIGLVIFDEFHERSLNADLGLAFCLDAQASLRPELRLLVMSATLDGAPIARLMGDAAVLASQGRAYPVTVRWLEKESRQRFEDGIASLIRRAMSEEPAGDLLVFLPGQGEISRVRDRLADAEPDILIAPLFGDLSQDAQDAALLPDPRRRKVVLATSIAETSLTIEGIRVVIDGGLMRAPRFDPNGGMARLVTIPVSKASAEQRRGRAGRLGPGICYPMWSEAAHRALAPFPTPEIADADLAPLVLELARWGVVDPATLSWLDPPPAAAFGQARDLLIRLDALDTNGCITAHGRAMAALPLHPRLAHMVLKAQSLDRGALACDLAALLSERDILKNGRDADLRTRLELLRDPRGHPLDRGALQRCREAARQMRRQLGLSANDAGVDDTGLLLAFAYPDRIALSRGGDGLHYRLSNGRGAFFPQPDPLCTFDALAVAELDGQRRDARIFLAAPLTVTDIESHFAESDRHLRNRSMG